MMNMWALGVHAFAVVSLVVAILLLSWLLGERLPGRETDRPYESGILPTGSARLRFPAKFYVVALLFVIFDLEAVFLFAWSIVATEAGWTGYAGAIAFVVILLVGLLYEWREGALDWSRTTLAEERAAAALQSSRKRIAAGKEAA